MRRPILAVWLIMFLTPFALSGETEPVSISQYTVRLHTTLRSEAITRDTPEHPAAVYRLCNLAATMRIDDRYESSQVLQGLGTRARRRLIDVRRKIELQLKRDKVEKPVDFEVNLKKLDGLLLKAASGQHAEFSGSCQNDLESELAVGGFAPAPDNGWMLVELITRVVSPDFWSKQGGPGTVQYYAMSRALVVRATTRQHEDIVQLLQALGGLPR